MGNWKNRDPKTFAKATSHSFAENFVTNPKNPPTNSVFFPFRSTDGSSKAQGDNGEHSHHRRCRGRPRSDCGSDLTGRLLHQHTPYGCSTVLPHAGKTKQPRGHSFTHFVEVYWSVWRYPTCTLPPHVCLTAWCLVAAHQQLLALDEVPQPGLSLQLRRGRAWGPRKGRIHWSRAVLLKGPGRAGLGQTNGTTNGRKMDDQADHRHKTPRLQPWRPDSVNCNCSRRSFSVYLALCHHTQESFQYPSVWEETDCTEMTRRKCVTVQNPSTRGGMSGIESN